MLQIQNTIIMENLKEILEQFEAKAKVVSTETELQSIFKELAPAFLYGGYIKVCEDYQVYIRTVEFYFHSEKDSGIHDPIVYHRNQKDLETAPYFPLMSLHVHNSGIDITFESETGEYRASALIRSYEVIDVNDNQYLKWDTKKCMFVKPTPNNYCFNDQSTYLKAILNGFAFGNSNDIKWVPSPTEKTKAITEKPRKNVVLFRKEGAGYEKVTKAYYEKHKEEFNKLVSEPHYFRISGIEYLQDPRPWQFQREDAILLNNESK